MTKLCARGKAAAKRKFRVYPSAYANAYASKICAGKIKDPSGLKRKDFKGPKPAGKKIGGEAKVKINEVIGGLKKASKTHAAQAKTLDSITKAKDGKLINQPYNGSYIKGNLGGMEVSNESLSNYYDGMID